MKTSEYCVGVIDDDRSDRYASGRRSVIGEDRAPIEEPVSGDDCDRVSGQVSAGLRVSDDLEPDVAGVVDSLLDEVPVWRDVERRLDPLVEVALQHAFERLYTRNILH